MQHHDATCYGAARSFEMASKQVAMQMSVVLDVLTYSLSSAWLSLYVRPSASSLPSSGSAEVPPPLPLLLLIIVKEEVTAVAIAVHCHTW